MGTLEEIRELRSQGLSAHLIADRLGMSERTVERRIRTLKKILTVPSAAVPDGFEVSKLSTRLDEDGNTTGQNIQAKPIPEDAAIDELVPAGHMLKGISTFVVDGEIKAQWIKTTRDLEQQALAQRAAVAALAESITPLPPIQWSTREVSSELLNLYTLTDCHVGMLAWARESGEPWDVAIAERCLTQTFLQMIASAPEAEAGVVNQLGDFLHFDGLMALTPTSGHVLDADSRFQKMVEVAVRILETIIYAAAEKHPTVRVYMHEGNHDMAGSVWLRVLFARLFRDNPRVIVEESPNPYVALQHGKTMLAFHHGHLGKLEKLPLIFATQFSKMWGETDYRYGHTGHMHHVSEKEHPGIRIEQHATLAAKDAYAARGGWHSVRQATSRTYHSKYGEVARATFLPIE